MSSSTSCGRSGRVIITSDPTHGATHANAAAFSDEEMTLLLSLAQPIEPAQRSAFLDAVAAAIGEQASGPGIIHQTARRIQKQFWTPPQLSPNATAPVHRGSAA
jgi:hypothetical protein